MREWKYTLKNGVNLRQAIKEENYEKILTSLKDCYKEIVNYFVSKGFTTEKERETEYEDLTEDIDWLLENINDTDKEELEESINYELSNFYDFCDNTNIWVKI